MKKILLFWILVHLLLLNGCFFPIRTTRVIGSGNLVTESRRVSDFSAVDLNGIGTLIIEQGSKESLEITAEDNIIGYLNSKVYGRNLRLDIQDFVNIDPRKEISYHLTVKSLERLETSGLGNIQIPSLKTDELDFEISGSGNADIGDLQAKSFRLEVSGLGNINIAGNVEDQDVELSGAGNYHAGGLFSREARIEISGTGEATIWVKDELDVELSGMGNLEYYGSPSLTSDVSGLGTIKSLGEK